MVLKNAQSGKGCFLGTSPRQFHVLDFRRRTAQSRCLKEIKVKRFHFELYIDITYGFFLLTQVIKLV